MKPFDKYDLYIRSVQDPQSDVDFIQQASKELRKKKAFHFNEDFCGTFANCCEWVKQGKTFTATGVDIDSEPIEYGKKNYLTKLTPAEQTRVRIVNSNVLSKNLPKAEVICAFNFSYFIFKDKASLLSYFKSCYNRLQKGGMLILDCFGGSKCHVPNEEEVQYKDFTYYWDQASFNSINHHAQFYIHYKRKGEKKREKVFSYDWRMWIIPEIREVLKEAGFKSTHVYWEGSDKNGEGNGIFTLSEESDDCESWVAYIAALN